jgi:hypothetical protein
MHFAECFDFAPRFSAAPANSIQDDRTHAQPLPQLKHESIPVFGPYEMDFTKMIADGELIEWSAGSSV